MGKLLKSNLLTIVARLVTVFVEFSVGVCITIIFVHSHMQLSSDTLMGQSGSLSLVVLVTNNDHCII